MMPSLGFGTWNIHDTEVIGEALRVGYRLIDTAKIYGNEEGVGAAVRNSHIPRQEIFVTTKLWNRDQGYESALAAFDESLERLGLHYVGLYLIHWPVAGKNGDSWRALNEIYKGGRAKAIGVSNFEPAEIAEITTDGLVEPAVNQIEFHPFIYRQQEPTLGYCKGQNVVVETYSPLGQGHLINDRVIKNLADKYQRTPAQILLRWAIQHDTVPIPKSSSLQRMRENLEVFDFELPTQDMQTLNALE